MPFTIPDVATAWNPIQARMQTGDLAVMTDASNGVGVSSGCAVTAQGSPNMTVAVASGTVRIAGIVVTVASGNVTVTANATGNPRLDLICVNSSGTKSAQAGTAAASPKYPAIPASSVVLAAVLVPTGASSITASNIVDKRMFSVATAALAENLLAWTLAQTWRLVSVTRNSDGAVTTASVVWPNGATGTYTADALSTAFPGATDAYNVTHVLGSLTSTVTQAAVTRDSATGAVTAQPALVVT